MAMYEVKKLKDDLEQLKNKYEILLATQVQILGRLKELEDKQK